MYMYMFPCNYVHCNVQKLHVLCAYVVTQRIIHSTYYETTCKLHNAYRVLHDARGARVGLRHEAYYMRRCRCRLVDATMQRMHERCKGAQPLRHGAAQIHVRSRAHQHVVTRKWIKVTIEPAQRCALCVVAVRRHSIGAHRPRCRARVAVKLVAFAIANHAVYALIL